MNSKGLRGGGLGSPYDAEGPGHFPEDCDPVVVEQYSRVLAYANHRPEVLTAHCEECGTPIPVELTHCDRCGEVPF